MWRAVNRNPGGRPRAQSGGCRLAGMGGWLRGTGKCVGHVGFEFGHPGTVLVLSAQVLDASWTGRSTKVATCAQQGRREGVAARRLTVVGMHVWASVGNGMRLGGAVNGMWP